MKQPTTVRELLDSTVRGRALLADLDRYSFTVFEDCTNKEARNRVRDAVRFILSEPLHPAQHKGARPFPETEPSSWAVVEAALSRTGTSAAEASKAFQGLQEASKDLVDLEIVVPGPEASAATSVRPVLRGGLILHENQRPPKEPDIDQALRDLFREPWHKRLWSWLRGTK